MTKTQKTCTISGKSLRISGPFYKFSCPYGTFVTLERDEWYICRAATPEEISTNEFTAITKEKCLGSIVRFRKHPHRYIIDQLFPIKSFSSLKKAIQFLVDEEGQFVLCS